MRLIIRSIVVLAIVWIGILLSGYGILIAVLSVLPTARFYVKAKPLSIKVDA